MSPAFRGTRAVLRLLPGLTLLLLLCPHASQGDCKLPPDIPNAQPALNGLTSFPEESQVTYKCNKGFVKVPGKPDTMTCQNGAWSMITEFCNRSCDVPTRLPFASLKSPYNRQNYFPVDSIVEYECRKGFRREHFLSGNVTCLQNFTWSKPDEFCKKKSCPNPGEIPNGHISIATDILFGASITFSCNTGYKLNGATSSYCILSGKDVNWSSPLPECKEISPPPKVTSHSQKPTTVDVPGTKAPLTPQKPTTVDVPGTNAPSTPQKPTTVDVPGTNAPSTPQKPTTVDVPGTKAPLTPQKPTTVDVPVTKAPLTPQKPTTANVAATEAPSTPQKPTTINSSAMKTQFIPLKFTLYDLPVPQKPITANDSPTRGRISPVPNALSTEIPATQPPNMANSSATQATPHTQRFTTAKVSLTQSLAVTQKFTAAHAPVTQVLHATQRLTSAHITATQRPATPRATTSFHVRSTPEGKGTPSAGVAIAYGLVAVIIIIGTLILVKIFRDYGKSGFYYSEN